MITLVLSLSLIFFKQNQIQIQFPLSVLPSCLLFPSIPPLPHHQHWLAWFSEPPFTWVGMWEDVLPQNESSRHLEVKCPSKTERYDFLKEGIYRTSNRWIVFFQAGKSILLFLLQLGLSSFISFFLCSPVLFRNDLFIPTQLKKYR